LRSRTIEEDKKEASSVETRSALLREEEKNVGS